jgi:c-di-GMP-binding flagellar brake protein YcgR
MHTTLASSQPRRRGERRAPLALRASIYNPLFETPVEVETADLSVGGMFVRSELLLAAGERLLVAFTVPGTAHQVVIGAEVVRTAHAGATGMGVSFDKLPSIDEAILRAGIERARGQG